MPGAFGDDETAAPRRRRAAAASTDGRDLVADGHRRRALHRRDADAPFLVVALRLRHQDDDRAPTRPRRLPGRGRARLDTAAESWPANPTACSSRTGRATPPAVAYAADIVAGAAREGPGVRDLPRPPDPRRSRSAPPPSSCVRPSRREPSGAPRGTGRVEITSQNHNYAVDADVDCRPARRHPRQPQRRGRAKGSPSPTRRAFSRAVPPRGRARPPRRPLPVRRVHRRSWRAG